MTTLTKMKVIMSTSVHEVCLIAKLIVVQLFVIKAISIMDTNLTN